MTWSKDLIRGRNLRCVFPKHSCYLLASLSLPLVVANPKPTIAAAVGVAMRHLLVLRHTRTRQAIRLLRKVTRHPPPAIPVQRRPSRLHRPDLDHVASAQARVLARPVNLVVSSNENESRPTTGLRFCNQDSNYLRDEPRVAEPAFEVDPDPGFCSFNCQL